MALSKHVMTIQAGAEVDPTPRGSAGEIELYLAEAAPPDDMDVLQWWGAHEDRFPHVVRMAAQYLACPASSAKGTMCQHVHGEVLQLGRSHP